MESSLKKFSFTKTNKIIFTVNYFFNLLKVPVEVKRGRIQIFYAELLWIFLVLLRRSFKIDNLVRRDYYETKFGNFYVQNNMEGLKVVSPAFERMDLDRLIRLISFEVNKRNKTLFIDVGAYFGDFTLKVANSFKNNSNLKILAFEPNPTLYKLLSKNVKLSRQKNIKTMNIGLGNKRVAGRQFSIDKLDNLITKSYLNKFDHIFIKLDIDGGEQDVLRGANELINNSKKITLLIEDFVDVSIVKYLKKNFIFLYKLTTYNSFWQKKQ